jgi:hypothetical protein
LKKGERNTEDGIRKTEERRKGKKEQGRKGAGENGKVQLLK